MLSVIYLIFNEGYVASSGHDLLRTDLSNEAIRLARIMHTLLPEQAEVAGLLALLLLHDSRRHARADDDNGLIALEHQNRRRWDQARITEGRELLHRTLSLGRVGNYQLQAAISALHAEAETWSDTDWPQIAALYGVLYQVTRTAVVRINQAVALSYADTPGHALQILDELAADASVQRYQPYHAARADILQREGRFGESRQHRQQAIDLSSNEAERRFLQRQLDATPTPEG